MLQYCMKNLSALFIVLCTTSLLAQSKNIFVPYLSYASYGSSSAADANATNINNKKDRIVGIYSLFDAGDHSFEFAIESKKLSYTKQNQTKILNQTNYIASYKSYLKNNLRLNTVIHYIKSSFSQDNGMIASVIGLNYVSGKKVNLGVEMAYSIYNANKKAPKVFQTKAYLSYPYGRKDSAWGMIFPKITFYYIKPLSSNIPLKDSYFSTEFKLIHLKNHFTSAISYWAGKQVYAIRDDGFTLYNLDNIHESGFSVSSRYTWSEAIGFKTSYENEYYKPLGSKQNQYMHRYIFLVDFNF